MAISPLVQEIFKPLEEVRYSSRDFSLMKEALRTWVQAHDTPFWNDLFESNIGVAYMDLISYLSDVLSFNMDKVANNSFIDVVERYRGMLHITNLLGYTPTAPVAARVPVRGVPVIPSGQVLELRGAYFDTTTHAVVPPSSFVVDNLNLELAYFAKKEISTGKFAAINLLDFPNPGDAPYSSLTVPKKISITQVGGLYIVSEDLNWVLRDFLGEYPLYWTSSVTFHAGEICFFNGGTYRSLQDGNIGHQPTNVVGDPWWVVDSAQNVYGLALLEGTSQADVFTPEPGGDFQKFVSSQGSVIEDSWVVFVNGARWEQQSKNTLNLATPTDQVYVIQFTEKGNLKIAFGDGLTHGAIPTVDVVLFYRTGGGVAGNHVIKGVASGNVVGYVNTIETPFTVNNVNTSGGFGGVDKESLDHIRYLAPGWFKTTERAITKNDILTLALKYVSPSWGSAGKAAVIRPQNDADNLNHQIPLTVPLKDLGGGHYALGNVSGGVPVAGTYDFLLNTYYPSYMANVMLVYIWCPVELDTDGDGIVDSVQYVSATDASKPNLLDDLRDYLNAGNLIGSQYQGDVGMSVVQTEVLDGQPSYIDIIISNLIVDLKFDRVTVKNNIRKAIYTLFATFVPGLSFHKHLLYTAIGQTTGVISFTLWAGVIPSIAYGDEVPVAAYQLLTVKSVDIQE
jgi:hypothetical protein